MAGAFDLLSGALNSNVGQTLVTAGAQRAAAEIYEASGFGSEEVDSPTAKVEAAPAPMDAGAEPARKSKSKWIWFGVGGTLLIGGFMVAARKKGGK